MSEFFRNSENLWNFPKKTRKVTSTISGSLPIFFFQDTWSQKNMPNKNKRKGNCFLCGKHNCALCQHCSDVHTCKLHFLSHRQNDYCFPFKIGDDQNSLVASRDIQPLELILFERPLALGPKYYDTTQKVSFLKPKKIFKIFL